VWREWSERLNRRRESSVSAPEQPRWSRRVAPVRHGLRLERYDSIRIRQWRRWRARLSPDEEGRADSMQDLLKTRRLAGWTYFLPDGRVSGEHLDGAGSIRPEPSRWSRSHRNGWLGVTVYTVACLEYRTYTVTTVSATKTCESRLVDVATQAKTRTGPLTAAAARWASEAAAHPMAGRDMPVPLWLID
jgi:hypothetical protein